MSLILMMTNGMPALANIEANQSAEGAAQLFVPPLGALFCIAPIFSLSMNG